MASISSAGIGSGLDINGIVSSLMAYESQPLKRLQAKESQYNAQLSAYGTLKSALSSFQSAMDKLGDLEKFKVFTATSSNTDVLTATASSTASAGTHTVQVTRIAEQHKLASGTSFASTDTLAANTMTLGVGGTTFNVDIGGKTLSEIATAINGAADNSGVTATVSKVDSGYKLLLTANDTGSSSALTASYSGADPFSFATLNTDRDSSGSFTSADLDAVLVLDGSSSLTATRTSNTVDDLLGGVTLTLKSAGTITLNTSRDTGSVTKSVQAFVDAFNSLRSTLNSQGSGTLQGDSALLSVESNILGVINTPPTGLTGSYNYLSEIGVSIQKDGTMALDTTALTNALDSDFTGVADLFANNDQGYAYRLDSTVSDMLTTDGLIESRTDGLNSSIESVKNDEDAMSRRLSIIEQRYRTQFTALDSLVSQLNSTGAYLTQMLSKL